MFSDCVALRRVQGKFIIAYILRKTYKILFSDHIAWWWLQGKSVVIYILSKTHKIMFHMFFGHVALRRVH